MQKQKKKNPKKPFKLTNIHPASSSSALIGKHRIAHKPNTKPRLDAVVDLEEEDEENKGEGKDGRSNKGILTEEDLWARLDELEKLEELKDAQER